MDEKSRLNLKKLISEYKPEETTDKIRSLKHSKMIRQEVMTYMSIKQKYSRLSKEQLYTMYQNKCNFLYNNYTNIFNKLVTKYIVSESKLLTSSSPIISTILRARKPF